jgi:hypothetical protein
MRPIDWTKPLEWVTKLDPNTTDPTFVGEYTDKAGNRLVVIAWHNGWGNNVGFVPYEGKPSIRNKPEKVTKWINVYKSTITGARTSGRLFYRSKE